MKSKESDNLKSNLEGEKLTFGEPDALKGASPVRGGGRRNLTLPSMDEQECNQTKALYPYSTKRNAYS